MGSKERFYLDIMAIHPEVTGSSHLNRIRLPNGEKMPYVADVGLFQEKEYGELNKVLPFNVEDIEFILATHNHVDHIGRLPFIVANGYRGNIYTSKDTAILMPLALEDSYKVLRDVAKKENRRVLYNEVDVLKTEALVQACNFYETQKINDHVKITLLRNGHLVGAAMILVQISYPGYEDINILYTGDYNSKNLFFDVPAIPEWVLELPLTVVIESTYGYMDSTKIKEVFENNVLDCVNEGGTVIAPVFSLGRAQEILYKIKCMQKDGSLKRDIPIYLDGKLAIKYTALYLKEGLLDIKPEMRDFLPDNFTYLNRSNRSGILEDYGRKIVLTTSGMGSYGPAQVYIPRYISRDDALIHFTGFCTEETLGGRLKKAEKGEGVLVGGLIAEKQAKVEYTTEYSAHAKADELIDFLKQFKDLKLVLVNHGQKEVKETFAKRILKEVKTKDIGILGNGYSFRINHYGLITMKVNEIN